MVFHQAGVSYTIAAEVQGAVSADFRNLALGDALSVVLRQVGAVAREEGGVILVVSKEDGDDPSALLYRSGIQGAPPIRITPAPEDPTVVASDARFLYVVRGAEVTKVEKARMAVVARGSFAPRRIRVVYGSDPTDNRLRLVAPPSNDPTFVTQDARFL